MTSFSASLAFMRQVLGGSENDLLKKHFLEDISYRSDQRNSSSRLTGLKEFRNITQRPKKNIVLANDATALVLTSSQAKMGDTQTYIERNWKAGKVAMVYRDELNYSFQSKREWLQFFVFALQISWTCFFHAKHRLNYALCIREVIEWACVLQLLKSNGLNEFIDFSSYEKDSNALAALIQQEGKRVTKIPSSGPLHAHYKYVVADQLVLSSAYQQEELPYLSSAWKVTNYLFWPPEQCHTYAEIYSVSDEPPAQTIGFYSHGEWLRRMEGHADPGLDILANEEALLASLSSFLQHHSTYRLVIFPHPKERNHSHTHEYYNQKLQGIPYEFSLAGTPSAHLFHTVDVGLMAYSTLIFERLGMGYKTFIARYTPSTFPVKGSELNGILFSSDATLEQQLMATEFESRIKYFERNNLSKHLISNFTRQL